jgi:hypothetical protein
MKTSTSKLKIANLPMPGTSPKGLMQKIVDTAKLLSAGEAMLFDHEMSLGNHTYYNYRLAAKGIPAKVISRAGKIYVVSTL